MRDARGDVKSTKEMQGGEEGGIDGTREPRLPRVAKRLEVPFM